MAGVGAELAAFGHPVHTGVCDLADAASVARYVADAQAALGGIDVLVNNASGFGMGDAEADWAASLNVDVMAMVRASHAAEAALLQAADAGRAPSDPALYQRTFNSIPFGRLGLPEEVADVALFLASPLARWVTGQTLTVDGGQLLGV